MVRLLASISAVLLALGLSGPAQASPASSVPPPAEAGGDALLRLISDRGWVSIDAAQQGVRRARDAASDLVLSAMHFLDLAYRRGGTSVEDGFDCSGFVRHVFQTSTGLLLPRRSDEQARADSVVPISRDELRPGDLVFFNTLRRAFSHVGIYVGDGKFIHSPRTGSSIRIEDMRKAYWTARFDGARRVAMLQASDSAAGESPSPR